MSNFSDDRIRRAADHAHHSDLNTFMFQDPTSNRRRSNHCGCTSRNQRRTSRKRCTSRNQRPSQSGCTCHAHGVGNRCTCRHIRPTRSNRCTCRNERPVRTTRRHCHNQRPSRNRNCCGGVFRRDRW